MPKTEMNILFVSPEVSPLVRTGGLGDVVGSLPIALKNLNLDVEFFVRFTVAAKLETSLTLRILSKLAEGKDCFTQN